MFRPFVSTATSMATRRVAAKSATPALARLSSSYASAQTDFSFLPTNRLETKPRKTGLTEIRAAYYTPMGPGYLKDLLETYGEYVDGLKFAGGSFTLMPTAKLRELIDLAHLHGVYVSTGGFIERVLAASGGDKALIERYLKACKDVGFDVLEISTGFISLPTEHWQKLVELTRSYGLKPKPELGIQFGAGGDTTAEELESLGTRDPAWVVERGKSLLDAGAEILMIESEGITENVKNWRTDVISKISSGLPKEKVMYEAADPKVFEYYIKEQGPDVNVFVDHSQIVQLACLRRGIWGTNQTFGRVVTFPE